MDEPPVDADDITQEQLLEFVNELIDDHPWQAFSSAVLASLGVLVGLGFLVWAITHAGKRSPTATVIATVLGLVTVMALIALMVEPNVEALAVAVGSGIGGLAAALAIAVERQHSGRPETPAGESKMLTTIMPHLRPDEQEEASYGSPGPDEPEGDGRYSGRGAEHDHMDPGEHTDGRVHPDTDRGADRGDSDGTGGPGSLAGP